jgi:hypothetical protein
MPSRGRDNPIFELRGTRGANSVPYFDDTVTTFQSGYDWCEDVTGPGDNAYLYVQRWRWNGGRINKPADGSASGSWFRNYACTYILGLSNIQHINILSVPSVTEVATSAAARTNPSRPYVDMPVAIKELADIPLLIKRSGENLISQLAGANLKTQFGILPLASDIAKLSHFQLAYNIRKRQLDNLFGPRGLRRTLDYGSYEAGDTYNATTQSNGVFISVPFTRKTKVTVRAHVRWNSTVQVPSDHEVPVAMRRKLFDAMLGLQGNNLGIGHLSTLWEALPWSWLIDWCGSVGDFLMAQRNIIPATLSSVRVMRHYRTEVDAPMGHSSTGATQTPIHGLFEIKRRDPAIIAPFAHFPILSGNQVGILASLLAAGKRR